MKQVIPVLITFILLITSLAIAQKKDHPLVGQLEGSELWVQTINNIQEYTIITGPIKDDKLVSEIKILGKTTTTAYRYRAGNSAFGIVHNYTEFFKKNGFKILYSCKSGECGGNISKPYLSLNKLETSDNSVAPAFWDPGYFRNYLSAKKEEEGKTLYVCIFIAQGWWSFPVYRVDVVESKPVKTKIVTSDIISKKISSKGSIALYGINFDTGKSTIKPESNQTLKEIATFLNANPKLKVYVVGHTDNVGRFTANMVLSKERAVSVVKSLTTHFKVKKEQLKAHGVSSLAPVTSNKTADGKARNRRVEIVEQ